MTPLEFFDYVGNTVKNFAEFVDKCWEWLKDYKTNIAEMSVNLMQTSFEFLTKITLTTPTYLFDNEWFRNNVLSFTGLSIVGIIVFAVWEGFKRMTKNTLPSSMNIQFTDMKRISKRVPLALAGSLLAPTIFVFGFGAVNWLTQLILDIGKNKIGDGIEEFNFNTPTLLEVVSYFGFTIGLIYFLIPIILANFSRWFTLIACGIISPLALSSWVFKSTEHFFGKFWSTVKKNSITQLVYAVFLLIVSSVMFGSKPPENSYELLIKMGTVIGGFHVMSKAHTYIGSYIAKNSSVSSMLQDTKNLYKKPKADIKKSVDTGDKIGEFVYEKVVPKGIKNTVGKLFGKKDLY